MADARIKILYLIDYFHRTGGTEKHLAQLIKGLPVEEFRCSLVAFDLGTNRLLDDLRDAGVPVIHLPVGREYVPSAAVQAWRLASLIRRNRYDIVQTFHQKSDSYGALVAWLAGARHLISSKRDTGDAGSPAAEQSHNYLQRGRYSTIHAPHCRAARAGKEQFWICTRRFRSGHGGGIPAGKESRHILCWP
jgi:hypothetical protein